MTVSFCACVPVFPMQRRQKTTVGHSEVKWPASPASRANADALSLMTMDDCKPTQPITFAGWRPSPSQRLQARMNKLPGLADISQRDGRPISVETWLKLANPASKGLFDDAAQIKKLVAGHPEFASDMYAQAIMDATEKGRLDVLQILINHVKKLDVLEKAEPALLSAIRFRPKGVLPEAEIFHWKSRMLDALLSGGIDPLPQAEALMRAAIEESGQIPRFLGRPVKSVLQEDQEWANETIKAILLNRPDETPDYFKMPYLMRLVQGIQERQVEG